MKIQINTLINQPIATVWAAYTEPKHIIHWKFATPEWHCPKAQNDLRVGGEYFARMEAKDGSFGFDFKAAYKQFRLKNPLFIRSKTAGGVQI